jgi:hypothetical protein
MKVMTISTKTNLNKISKMNSWGVYNYETGELAFIGMSRSSARDYKNSFEDSSHLTGPRKVNVTAKLA